MTSEALPPHFYTIGLRHTLKVSGYLDAVKRFIPLENVDSLSIAQLYEQHRGNQKYDNEFVSVVNDRLLLIAEIKKRIDPKHRPQGLIWFWNNHLWPMYTLTFYWKTLRKERSLSYSAFIPADSQTLELLRRKPTLIYFLRNRKCIAAMELDLPSVDRRIWSMIGSKSPYEFVRDVVAAKALVEGEILKPTSNEMKLEHGWAKKLETEVAILNRMYRDPKLTGFFEAEKKIVHSSRFAVYFPNGDFSPAPIYSEYQDAFSLKEPNLQSDADLLQTELSEAEYHRGVISHIRSCAWFSAANTNRGRTIRSVDLDGTVRPVVLDADRLGDRSEIFWERLPFDIPYYYEQLFGNASCSMDISELPASLPRYEGDIEKGEEFVSDLLTEAAALKQWTIPFGAYVQLEIGPISAVKLFEIGSEVACVLVNDSGDYWLVWLHPLHQEIALTGELEFASAVGYIEGRMVEAEGSSVERPDDEPFPSEFYRRIQLALKMLLAAIVRDFWVVEERARVFAAARSVKRTPRLRADWGEKTVVYLPRVRYIGDIEKRGEPLDFVKRRPHFVIGHLRKALEASSAQIRLAREYSIVVPKGFTFVRPHRRGDKAQERIYRSRSALQCIRALGPVPVGAKDAWFTYELNVKNWLATNGFDVAHIAGNKHGDGGVDIQAHKGAEHLLVQCKYWQARIGPNVVRELMGTLQTFPKGARGVIVTSSELTGGAKKLATENKIQYIERADFGTALNYAL